MTELYQVIALTLAAGAAIPVGGLLPALVMAAAGGIMALVFHDNAPLAYRRGHPGPAMGMILGFGLGFAGLLFL